MNTEIIRLCGDATELVWPAAIADSIQILVDLRAAFPPDPSPRATESMRQYARLTEQRWWAVYRANVAATAQVFGRAQGWKRTRHWPPFRLTPGNHAAAPWWIESECGTPKLLPGLLRRCPQGCGCGAALLREPGLSPSTRRYCGRPTPAELVRPGLHDGLRATASSEESQHSTHTHSAPVITGSATGGT